MLKVIVFAICMVAVMFFFDVLLPRIKLEYKLHKEIQAKRKRQKAFKNKMKELEIR